MKSPAMRAAMQPIRRMDAVAAETNRAAMAEYQQKLNAYKKEEGDGPPEKPAQKRFIVTDATYEAIGVIMADNPNGIMGFRDELVSMLKPLDREENAPARGFYLTAWNGTDSYTFDRIIRGHQHIPVSCLSLLGAAQPGRIADYMHGAVRGGAGDDGFVQRFGLLVWPDISPTWRDVDREPDVTAKRHANLIYDRLNDLDPSAIGAERDEFDPLPYVRFSRDALAQFQDWRGRLEPRLRGDDLPEGLCSHLAKYRGLIPKLALLFHLIDGHSGPVGSAALGQALKWAAYLETHAARAYASVGTIRASGAATILGRIKKQELPDPFTARDVHSAGWSGLTDRNAVANALALLIEYNWLVEQDKPSGPRGGRPTKLYWINPAAKRP
jgi:hypothetical protein